MRVGIKQQDLDAALAVLRGLRRLDPADNAQVRGDASLAVR